MAELILNKDERPGILKEIDEGAMDLVFQAIQEDIYSFPIKSFVREAISNGLDSIIEKKIFRAIDAGEPVENYYRQQQDGKLLKDSEYTPEYYQKESLSNDIVVHVLYRDGTPRDSISITDYGVGLAGSRLQGFFKLGYSSKRNLKDVIGKFGAGAKAGLATGVDYFLMQTTYNGYTTQFMIFKNDYEAITPKSAEGKEEVWEVKMSNGTTHKKSIFWEKSSKSNGVTITLEVKKHNKKAFIEAVKSQFQYFGGKVELTYDKDGVSITDKLNDSPLYESDNLVIPQYSTYIAPHILVDGIAYGLISWDELELERRTGKLAIKVKATEVDITQSRESLKWTEKTKMVILAAIRKCEKEAVDYVTAKSVFTSNDPLTVNEQAASIENDEVSTVFSKFLHKSKLSPNCEIKASWMNPKYAKQPLNGLLFDFLFYEFKINVVKTYTSGGKLKIDSTEATHWNQIKGLPIVYAIDGSFGPRLAEHVLNTEFNSNSVVYFRKRTDRLKSAIEFKGDNYPVHLINDYVYELLSKKERVIFLDKYKAEYPDDNEDDLDGADLVSVESAAKLRRLNQQVLFSEYDYGYQPENIDAGSYECGWYTKQKTVKRIEELENEAFAENTIITTGKYSELAKFMEFIKVVLKLNVDIIYVSQDNLKHVLPYGILITDYFRKLNTKTGELMIGKHVRDLNTLYQVSKVLENYSNFKLNFRLIESVTNVDTTLLRTANRTLEFDIKKIILSGFVKNKELVEDIFDYLDKLAEFHNAVKSGNKEDITAIGLEFFNSDEIYTIDAYDEELVSSIKTQLDEVALIGPLADVLPSSGLDTDTVKLLKLLINTVKQNDHI